MLSSNRKSLVLLADKLPPATGGIESHGKYFIEHFSAHLTYNLHVITKDAAHRDVWIQEDGTRLLVDKHSMSQLAPDIVFYNSGAWIEQLSTHKEYWPEAKYVYRTGGNEIIKAPLVDHSIHKHSARQHYWVQQLNATLDVLITNSNFTEQRLQALGITCEFVKVVGGACTEGPAQKTVRPIPLFVSAARFVPYKNHALLIKVFHMLHQRDFAYQLQLYGDGELWGTIQQLVYNYGLQNKIELLGATDNRVVCRAIAQADFYVQFSQDVLTQVPGGSYLHTEGMGRSILEAIVANTFVIAGKAGALEEIITASNGILLDLNDHKHLVDQIQLLAQQPPRVNNEIDYSWKNVFTQYESIFSRICGF